MRTGMDVEFNRYI